MVIELPLRWLYVDFNSYFASVEQQLNPELRGKPIVVVPVQTDSTCAIAASYEAKACGIKTGTPIYEAKRLCPDLICVLAQHEAYVDFHHRILAEIDRHIPVHKVWSIDEVACQLMDNENSIERASAIAHNIKRGVAKNIGSCMTCSIGIAPNRYLAKIATDMQKPDGLVFLHADGFPHHLYSLKLRDLPGIGRNMEERLMRSGITDMRTLCSLDLKQIRKAWGSILGERIWYYLRGVDLPDEPESAPKSISHSHVLGPELRAPDKARQVARRLTLKLASRLRRMRYVASNIALSLYLEDGAQHKASRHAFEASDSMSFLALLDQMWQEIIDKTAQMRIKKVLITLHQLAEVAHLQPELFSVLPEKELKARKKAERISVTLDTINQRYGKDSLLLGGLPIDEKGSSISKVAFTSIPDKEEFME